MVASLRITILFLANILCLTTYGQQYSIAQIASFPKNERKLALQSTELDTLPDSKIYAWLDSLKSMNAGLRDPYCEWWIGYQSYLYRQGLYSTPENAKSQLQDLLATAHTHKLDVEAVLIKFYQEFDRYNIKEANFSEHYNLLTQVFSKMEELGWSNYTPYRLPRLYRYIGRFFYESGESERALHYLREGEKTMESVPYAHRNYLATCNLIQTIHQEQGNTTAAIHYAKKILNHLNSMAPSDRDFDKLHEDWTCIASIDLAAMYLEQGKKDESERVAHSCYALLQKKIRENPDELGELLTEFDVLQALIPVKIALNKLPEAKRLLVRTDSINPILDSLPKSNRFRKVKFYRNYASYYEKTGKTALAFQYFKWSAQLNDELQDRNNRARVDQLSRLSSAHKLKAHLESEVKLHKSRNQLLIAGLIVLALLVIVVWLNYLRAITGRALARKDAELSAQKLVEINHEVLEKTELTQLLKTELENLTRKSEKSQHLEQLKKSSILTEEDWSEFKILFEKVYPNHMPEIQSLYPDLTQAELRYLLLEKLDLTTHEMSKIIGISDVAIRQTRFRLRNKLKQNKP